MLMYDERKNKMVSYNSTGFDHDIACQIYHTHTETKNKKLEAYTEKNYKFFVVNPMIEEHQNPFLIFNVEK